jgi:hypothetical protein
MKSSIFIASVILGATLVSAVPTPSPHRGGNKGKGKGKGKAAAAPVGAAFFISNEPTGNQVVVNNIAADGTLVGFASGLALM